MDEIIESKLNAIAANGQRLYNAGNEEGYTEGYIDGHNAANPEIDNLLEQILKKQNELIGYDVIVCPLSVTWSGACYVSKTKPSNVNDYDAIIDSDTNPITLTGVKELYIWHGGDDTGAGIRVSEINEHDGGYYTSACTYTDAYMLAISSNKTIYCICDHG